MYSFGDIVLIRFPFSDIETLKKRPGFVLSRIRFSSKMHLYIIAMITSKTDTIKLNGDVKIGFWEKAGLLHPSQVRLAKIATLEDEIIERQIGTITKDDMENIQESFKKIFKEIL